MSELSTITFLGTGTSVGVPVIGCECDICLSQDSKNKRLRSSIYVELAGFKFIIDSGPDIRQQSLRAGLTQLDAVLITHIHTDHIAGFDDLRAFCWRRDTPLPIYSHQETLEKLAKTFHWGFAKTPYPGYLSVQAHPVTEPFNLSPQIQVTPLLVEHGSVATYGYRIDCLIPNLTIQSWAYISDVKIIPEATLAQLQGLDLLIIDGLRWAEHPSHFNIQEATQLIEQLAVPQAYLTHISHEVEHHDLISKLPPHIQPAYDGLVVGLGINNE